MYDTDLLALAAIGKAIHVAEQHPHADKAWVVDQMVRALTGVDYTAWRAAYEADGSEWDEGEAP